MNFSLNSFVRVRGEETDADHQTVNQISYIRYTTAFNVECSLVHVPCQVNNQLASFYILSGL